MLPQRPIAVSQHILFPHQTQALPPGPAWAILLLELRSIFYQISGPAGSIRAPRDKSGLTERIRAPQYESGPRRMNQGPESRGRARQVELGSRGTDHVSAGPIRALQNEAACLQDEPRLRNTNESGPGRTNYGPAGRTRVPVGRIRAPRDKARPCETDEGPA